MAAMKPRTGDGPLEVTKEGRGIVMRVPLEGGGRLVVEISADEAAALGDALKAVVSWPPARALRPGRSGPGAPEHRAATVAVRPRSISAAGTGRARPSARRSRPSRTSATARSPAGLPERGASRRVGAHRVDRVGDPALELGRASES